MAISTFPDVGIGALVWGQQSNTQSFTSPLDGSTQTLEMPGSRWTASLSMPILTKETARKMTAFLVKLRGESGRFYLFDHSLPNPNGLALGSPVVSGANQSGTSIDTSGWDASISALLKEGDLIGIGDELKMVMEVVNSDSSGLASIVFEPPIRKPPTDGSEIVLHKPKAIMRLTDDSVNWNVNAALHYKTTLNCIEAF